MNDDMSQTMITCPKCKTQIKLNESIAGPLIEATKKEFEQLLADKELDFSRREATIKDQQEAVQKSKEGLNEQVAAKVRLERDKIVADESKKARLAASTDIQQKEKELSELQDVLRQKDVKLNEAQQAQAAVLRQQRELHDAKREMELTIEKRIQESLVATRMQARKEAEDGLGLRVAEKDKTITDLQTKLQEALRKAEQGSQQLQGEVQELQLEAILRERFPTDVIEPVPKGEFGGDAVQRVIGTGGQPCGAILWESKRTKNWVDSWLPKLREDQRAAKAEISVLVSQTLPKGCESFDLMDGVWVTSMKCALSIAVALRQSLIELTAARKTGEGQQTKMQMVYAYLMGPLFRQRIQAIVERFSEMEEDLAKERKSITRAWSKREGQIRCAIDATAGMYGDLQGIAGRTLQEPEELKLLADGKGKAVDTELAEA